MFIRRALIAFGVIVILTSILVTNLYHLQIVRHEDYQTRSNDNRIKLVPTKAVGIIYDRRGTQLALNSIVYQLEIVPEKVSNLQETLDNLRSVVDLTDEDITNFEKERKRSRRFTSIALNTA